MHRFRRYSSQDEIAEIVSTASGLDICTVKDFLPIILKYYHTLIEKGENFECCYFNLNDNYSTDESLYTSLRFEYRVISYTMEKLINENLYRISFDSYGILLLKICVAYISGGISGVMFSSIEHFIEYLIKSNVNLSNTQVCVLYTILLDSKCNYEYFDEDYLYEKYYKGLSEREDTCLFNLTEIKCIFNEDINRCIISKGNLKKLLEKLEHKKILEQNEIGKYRIR